MSGIEEEPGERYILSSPLAVLSAGQLKNQERIMEVAVFDGILLVGKSLRILKPAERVVFQNTLRVEIKSKKRYKGITLFEDCHKLFEISLGNCENLEMAILFRSGGAIPNEPPFKNIISNINKCMDKAIINLGCNSLSRSELIQTGYKLRTVYPSDWEFFAKEFHRVLEKTLDSDLKQKDKKLRCFPDVTEIFYSVQRMGQNLQIIDTTDDLDFSMPYRNINTDQVLSLAIHIALDLYDKNGDLLFWNLNEVVTKLGYFGKPNSQHNVLFLPGLGNINYQFKGEDISESKSKQKFLQMYLRCGHQAHNDSFGFYKYPYIAKRLAELQASLLLPSKATVTYTEKDQAMLSLMISKPIDGFIKQLQTKCVTRCELVWEQTIMNLGIDDHMHIAYRSALNWIKSMELQTPQFLVPVKRALIETHVKSALLPCKKTIENAILSVKKSLGDVDEDYPTLEMGIPVFCTPHEYENVLIAEAIIGFFLTGRFLSKWPAYIRKSLGFDVIEETSTNQPCAILNVLFSDQINCLMPARYLHDHLPKWLLQNSEQFRLLNEELYTLKTCEINQLAKQTLILIMSVLRRRDFTSDNEKINLKSLKSCNSTLALGKQIRCVHTFVAELVNGNNNDERLPQIRPSILQTLCSSLNSMVKDKRNTDFQASLVLEMETLIAEEKLPAYLLIHPSVVCAVTIRKCTDSKHVISLGKIYSDMYRWLYNNDIGQSGINCSTAFLKTIQLYCAQEDPEKSYSPIEYVRLISQAISLNGEEADLRKCLNPKVLSDHMLYLIRELRRS